MLLFSLCGGWASDRWPRTTVLILAHLLILIQALSLGGIVQNGLTTFSIILFLAFVFGCAMSFEVPARQALIFDLVGKDDIVNGVAIHSMVFNLAHFIGPAIAGFIISSGFIEGCFYLKGVSTLSIIIILFYLTSYNKTCSKGPAPSFSDREESKAACSAPSFRIFMFPVELAQKNPFAGQILLLILCFSILLLPYSVLLPSIAKDMLGLGPKEYGFISSANGIGALTAASLVAICGHRGERKKWWLTGAALFPASVFFLSLINSYPLAIVALFFVGFTMVIAGTSAVSLLQIISEDEERGKVMGAFTVSFMGFFPLGSLICGWSAQAIGTRYTLFCMGLLAFFVVAVQMLKCRGRT
jgi:MFS family permease